MRILIACEYSNIVASAFRSKGHHVISCDIIPNDVPGTNHQVKDVFEVLKVNSFDMMIAFPPCTYLCKAQIPRYYSEPFRYSLALHAMDFVKRLYAADINKICIENPIGYLNTHWRKPDQIINPAYFGNQHSKDVCLWLKNLPPLISTCFNNRCQPVSNHVNGRMSQSQKSKIKSKFFPEIAEAMANQWN